MASPRFSMSATVLGTPDPPGLATFYAQLLGWDVTWNEPDWAMIKPPGGGSGLSFQLETEHVEPVWPARDGDQQMQLHLDIAVDDLSLAVARAVELGARQAEFQPQDNVRVMLDPAGHPFCLFREGT
jgi:catechol 2,3-dioxygenase-like lactoylglutathione lyase family enzyme